MWGFGIIILMFACSTKLAWQIKLKYGMWLLQKDASMINSEEYIWNSEKYMQLHIDVVYKFNNIFRYIGMYFWIIKNVIARYMFP